ncbi:MAG: alpha-E domain-containing protein [Acidimicrobiales bacterium]
MLARDAESLFWSGRYLERAEDTARLLDVAYHGMLETTPAEEAMAWRDVLSAVRLDGAFADTKRALGATSVSEYLVLDPQNPGSILSAVEQARENARTVREQLSTELWESLNSFCLELRARNLRADLEFQPHELYGMVRRQCQTVAGVAAETMARDEGWRFFVLGWNLERAEMSCRLLSVRYRQLSPSAFHQWMGTLRSASALEAYRRTYRASMDPVDVVEFLLLSRTFPRSVLFSLRTAETALARLAPDGELTRPLRQLGRVRSALEYADVRELMQGDLGDELHLVEEGIRQVAASVATQYFSNSHEFDLHSLHLMPGQGPFGPRDPAHTASGIEDE